MTSGKNRKGFRKGRGTGDGLYVRPETDGREETGGTGQYGSGVRRPGESFDRVPREMVMATQRWMGVPEAEVRMVEGTYVYEKTTAREVVGEGASEEFEVNIGLRQGSVLSPLLFIAVLDLISRKTSIKDGGEGCHEETPLCRRSGPGGEWQTGRRPVNETVEWAVYQTRYVKSTGWS